MTTTSPAERMMGLNQYSRNFLAANSAKQEKNGFKHGGTLGIPYYMNQYTLPDGRILQEQVQAECGGVGDRTIFIALRDEQGAWIPQSLWTEESIWLASL